MDIPVFLFSLHLLNPLTYILSKQIEEIERIPDLLVTYSAFENSPMKNERLPKQGVTGGRMLE
jgi:hypothetical protein